MLSNSAAYYPTNQFSRVENGTWPVNAMPNLQVYLNSNLASRSNGTRYVPQSGANTQRQLGTTPNEVFQTVSLLNGVQKHPVVNRPIQNYNNTVSTDNYVYRPPKTTYQPQEGVFTSQQAVGRYRQFYKNPNPPQAHGITQKPITSNYPYAFIENVTSLMVKKDPYSNAPYKDTKPHRIYVNQGHNHVQNRRQYINNIEAQSRTLPPRAPNNFLGSTKLTHQQKQPPIPGLGELNKPPRMLALSNNEFVILKSKLQGALFGGVYEGTEFPSKRRVAVKTVRRDQIDRVRENGPAKDIFEYPLAELCLARICEHSHPHILDDYKQTVHGDYVYLISPLADQDMLDYLAKRPQGLPEMDAARFIKMTVHALASLHEEHSIAWQDMSLENMLIFTQDGKETIKICDPGHATTFPRGTKGEELPIKWAGYCGKLSRAPEMYESNGSYLATKIDCWVVGWSVFYLLTGFMMFGSAENNSTDENYNLYLRKGLTALAMHRRLLHKLSPKASQFIEALVRVNPSSRMSMLDALQHPWLAQVDIPLPKINPIRRQDNPIGPLGQVCPGPRGQLPRK